MPKFKELECYLLNVNGKDVKAMCIGVGSKFSFFSPVSATDKEAIIDATRVWIIANDDPEESAVNKIIIPVENLKHGKED